MRLLVAYLTRYAIAIIVAVANLCLAIVHAVADLPGAAVGVAAAPVDLVDATVGRLAAELPFVALVVSRAESLPCNAFVGGRIAAGPVYGAVLVVYAVADLWLADVRLEVAALPSQAIAIKIAFSGYEVATFAHGIAFFPGIAVLVRDAVAGSGAAFVGCGIAELECRIALRVGLAVARCRLTVLFGIADLPDVAVRIGSASVRFVGAAVRLYRIAGHEGIFGALGF